MKRNKNHICKETRINSKIKRKITSIYTNQEPLCDYAEKYLYSNVNKTRCSHNIKVKMNLIYSIKGINI